MNHPKFEPAVYLQAVNAAVAVALAFQLFPGWIGEAAIVAASGLAALVTAILTRPVVVSALTGAGQTVLTAAVMFGLPLNDQQSGAILALVAIVLGLVLRPNVTPAATVRLEAEAARHAEGDAAEAAEPVDVDDVTLRAEWGDARIGDEGEDSEASV